MPISPTQLEALHAHVKTLYAQSDDLPFHGWHHIAFVYKKAAIFAKSLGADIPFTQSAALVHDLNYLAVKRQWSPPSAGQSLRETALKACGYDSETLLLLEETVLAAETAVRNSQSLSKEAQALSDADTLFKALPTTPILFASRFIQQTGYSIRKLANKVVTEQAPLLQNDLYFYSPAAKETYLRWAQANLALWQNVQESFADPDILALLEDAGFTTNT